MVLIEMGRFQNFILINVETDHKYLEYIVNSFNPLHDDGNHGINLRNKILRGLTIR